MVLKSTQFMILTLVVVLGVSTSGRASESLGIGTEMDAFSVMRFPDPVKIENLNFYMPSQDLIVPCHIPIQIFRAYNSFSTYYTGPFGPKWTFIYSTYVLERFGEIVVYEPDGFETVYSREGNLQKHKERIVDQIVAERKKEDARKGTPSVEAVYTKLRSYLMTNSDSLKDYQKRYFGGKTISISAGRYKALSRGTSELIKTTAGYERIFRDGQREIFDRKGKLSRVVDRNNNGIEFSYEGNLVRKVQDSCKRFITISYNAKNRIIQITDSLGKQLMYAYDQAGYLSSFTDIAGKVMRYYYDKQGLMTKVVYPNGNWTTIAYDAKGLVASQADDTGLVMTYKKTPLPGEEARRITKVVEKKGKFQRKEIYDIEGKRRTSVKEYNENNVLIKDETTTLSACCARPVSITDRLNDKNILNEYDEAGNLVKRTDSTGYIVRFEYEPNFNQVAHLTDSQGADYYFYFDGKGNLTDGFSIKDKLYVSVSHNNFGKIVHITKYSIGSTAALLPQLRGKVMLSTGQLQGILKSVAVTKLEEVLFDYNYFGKPIRIRLVNTGSIDVSYYATGDIKDVSATADRSAEKRFAKVNAEEARLMIIQEVRSTLQDMLNLLRPANMQIGF